MAPSGVTVVLLFIIKICLIGFRNKVIIIKKKIPRFLIVPEKRFLSYRNTKCHLGIMYQQTFSHIYLQNLLQAIHFYHYSAIRSIESELRKESIKDRKGMKTHLVLCYFSMKSVPE